MNHLWGLQRRLVVALAAIWAREWERAQKDSEGAYVKSLYDSGLLRQLRGNQLKQILYKFVDCWKH